MKWRSRDVRKGWASFTTRLTWACSGAREPVFGVIPVLRRAPADA
jgi:hypothetical protein